MRKGMLLLTLMTAIAIGSPVQADVAESITLHVDRATIIPAPEGTTTLVVGNPAIADTAIQRNNVVVLTGKSYGTTNIVALDSTGKTIKEILVHVRSPEDKVITVHRGVDRASYSCTPVCEPTLRMGDTKDFFDEVGAQYGARNGFAQGQAAANQSR